MLFGEHLLEREVSQVVSGLFRGQRAGTLAVVRAEDMAGQDAASVTDMAGIVLITSVSVPVGAKSPTTRGVIGLDADVEHAVKICTEAATPVLLLPGFGEPREVAEEIRATYWSEIKKISTRLHTYFIRVLIEEGLNGLVERLGELVGRPIAVETADFKILAAQNMGATPVNQQRTLTEEVAEELNRELREQVDETAPEHIVEPVRLGRRLVVPVVLEGTVVGYLSMMVRPSDNVDLLCEYLRPAAVAALVDFSQRRRELSSISVTHKSLLKDLLAGHSLAADDFERLEQYFGFDICDGLLVFAVKILPDGVSKTLSWLEERQALLEMEGASVIVLPFLSKQKKTWQDVAEELKAAIKKQGSGITLQLGAGRLAETILDLPDSYREARQALVTGSMIHGDAEFLIGYGDLGIKRILYLIIDHPELDRFYEEHLSPLEVYDAEWETELVPTLRVYLEQGANLNSAAKELFIHRHTMRYRLEQIADLLKVDIDSTEVLLNLQIAFQIKDMKGSAKS